MKCEKAFKDCKSILLPVRDTLDVISGKWKLPIIISIGAGNHRFTTIMKSINGISPKVLAKELKELESHGIVNREVTPDYPVSITYSLEEYAESLQPLISVMQEWGNNHRKKMTQEALASKHADL